MSFLPLVQTLCYSCFGSYCFGSLFVICEVASELVQTCVFVCAQVVGAFVFLLVYLCVFF